MNEVLDKLLRGIAAVSGVTYTLNAQPGMTLQRVYHIDKQVDDGLPQSGRALALYIDGTAFGGTLPGSARQEAAVLREICHDDCASLIARRGRVGTGRDFPQGSPQSVG